MEPIWQTQSIVELRFSSVKIKQLRRFGRFYLLRVSTSKRSPKRMQLSLIVGIAFGFWLISDLPISGWSGFPHFRFSVFPGFNISGVRVNLHFTFQSRLNRRFIWGCSSEISIFWSKMRSAKLIFWFSSKLSPLNDCFTELFSSKRDSVSPVLSFGLLAWDSKMAAYQQFLKHIYWNFMESGISGIGIWLNLWVSASNELGKPYFWQNLLEVDPLR